METKIQVVKRLITNYLQSVQISSPKDFEDIAPGVMNIRNAEYDAHNTAHPKDEKWKKRDSLEYFEIVLILKNLFVIRQVSFDDNDSRYSCELCILIDKNLVAVLPSKANDIGIYRPADEMLRLLARMLDEGIRSYDCDEIIKSLQDNAPVIRRTIDKNLIPLKNGVFIYNKKELRDYNDEDVFICKSKVSYNPKAKNITIHNANDGTDWDVESWMMELADGDKEICNVLWEVTGALLRPFVSWNKSAWLYSTKGNNGKGTLCEMYRSILGDGSFCSIPLDKMGDAFALEGLTNSNAIIVDENDVGTYIDKAANLKALITNDVITVTRKFKTSLYVKFRGFMVQCLNSYPCFQDHSDSLYRRQLFIPMNACFTGAERKYIKEDYVHRQEVLEYVVYRVLNMNYENLSEPLACKLALKDFAEMNDPVLCFWSEIRNEVRWNLLPFTFLYALYKQWIARNKPNGKVIGKNQFMKRMEEIVGNDSDWMCRGTNIQIPVNKSNMDGPEPLIKQYNLVEWMNDSYKGSNINEICTPVLKSKYSGIERLNPLQIDANVTSK